MMIKQSDILNAYLFLRENNHSIPSETLNFMRDVSMRELKKIAATRTCFNCKHDGLQGVFRGGCTGCGDSEYKNFEIKA